MEDPPVMPFEMKNLTSFLMEQWCFDLKLEMLEQMDAKDVVELTKVNQGFQGMLVRDPSIVFGQHVPLIQLCDDRMWIIKFSNLDSMKLDVNPSFSHFSFVKKIRSCDYLRLKSYSKEALEKFFSNFHASIKQVGLDIKFDVPNEEEEYDGDEVDPMIFERGIKDLIEDFIVARLKDCEEIEIEYYSKDLWRFYYNALLRTQIKNVVVNDEFDRCMDLITQQIVTNGIPSRNPEAAIFIHSSSYFPQSYFTMDLSQYPGMRRIDGENRLRLLKEANDFVCNLGYFESSLDFAPFTKESAMFRRRIDSTKDCVCVYYEGRRLCPYYFFAFYVPVH